jgi:glycosyltransferase involved in cell wall biosynthesis
VLAGEGELTDEIKALAASAGLADDTFFIGRCDNIAELLFVSDICVLTSWAEGFSNSILEYMAAGRPVVATDVGGAGEAIAHGESGYVVKSDDDEHMAEHVLSLLRDPQRARQMGSKGRERVREHFSDHAQLKNTTAMYERLLSRSTRHAPGALKHAGAEPG